MQATGGRLRLSGPGDGGRCLSEKFSHRATETRRSMRRRNAPSAPPTGARPSAAPCLREIQSLLTGKSNSERKTGFLTEPQRHGEVLQSDARHCNCVSHHRRPSMISAMPVLSASCFCDSFVLFVPFVVHPQRHQGYQNGMR